VREVRQAFGDGNVGLATHKLAKNFAEPWDESAKLAMAAFQAASANLDGITMQTYINMLCTQPTTDRILLYYTDGQMPAEDHSNQLTILKRQLRRARAMAKLPNHRLHVVGIALDNDAPKKYGLDTILVDSDKPDESVRLVVEGLAERIARSINK
jgi:nitric oxide reductase activation protein